MDLEMLVQSLQGTLGATLPALLGALAILVVGWFVALLVRAGLRRSLDAIGLDRRIEESAGRNVGAQNVVARIGYWVVMAMTGIAFFNALALQNVSTTLQTFVDQFFAFLPKGIAAAAILLVAWVVATVLRAVAERALAATTLDERLAREADAAPLAMSLGNVLYWLVILLFLPAALGALELRGLLAPVENMVGEVLGMLPNVFSAAVIGGVGYLLARILRDVVRSLLEATGIDAAGERAGLAGDQRISGVASLLVYVFVLVPALVAALDALKIEAISGPATQMLGEFMAAIPPLFGAAVILTVSWYVAQFVAELLSSLLAGFGFDALPERMGVAQIVPEGERLSRIAGRALVFFVMLFAVTEAAGQLGFGQVSALVSQLIAFGAQVLLGIVIICTGIWISNVAVDATERMGGEGAQAMARVVRFGILGMVVAMGLRAMGLANDIVNLAFGLTLGALAVAFALSFGLGGREAAGRQMDHWLAKMREE